MILNPASRTLGNLEKLKSPINDKNKAARKDNVRKSFNGTAVPKTKVPDLLGIAYSNNQTPREA